MTQTLKKSTLENKTIYINEIFSKIALYYDLLNNLMTFGLHKKWKDKAIKLALEENPSPQSALDICCGTADLAILISNKSSTTKILAVDNCKPMLDIAKSKLSERKNNNIKLLEYDCENLDFTDLSFDLISIGFGLRNLTNKEKCIKDVHKLLNKNGVFVCIDLGYPSNPLWQKIYFYYFYKIVPRLGQLFAKNKEAYTYLPESLKTWYKQDELKDLILKTGFSRCYYKIFFGGVVASHIAVK